MFMFTKVMDLPRITSISSPDHVLDKDLAVLAYRELNYAAMSNACSLVDNHQEVIGKLLAAGVHPLQTPAVERYKTHMQLRKIGMTIGLQVVFVVMTALAFTVTKSVGWLVLAAAVAGSTVLWLKLDPFMWEWNETTLRGYPRPVPAHVLSLAVSVKAALGLLGLPQHEYYGSEKSGFYVEEFAKRQRVIADPFLVLYHKNVKVYLAAWDEPSFK